MTNRPRKLIFINQLIHLLQQDTIILEKVMISVHSRCRISRFAEYWPAAIENPLKKCGDQKRRGTSENRSVSCRKKSG